MTSKKLLLNIVIYINYPGERLQMSLGLAQKYLNISGNYSATDLHR